MHGWHGIYPVLYAFWDDQGRLDRNAMARQVEFCLQSGAHGITVLGLVTETHKMDVNERLYLVEMVGELIGGRLPYAVTVCEPSIEGQISFARAARRFGADWVILQPPATGGTGAEATIDFFARTASALDFDVGIQNNPVNLAVSLSADDLVRLFEIQPNIRILKGEGFSVDIARVITALPDVAVFGGHGGIEFPSLLRAGGRGLIPAPDFLKAQVNLYRLWREGTEDALKQAEAIHRAILPAVVFMSRSVPAMLCYGKRLFAEKAGIRNIMDREPSLQPTPFGLSEMAIHLNEIARAEQLGRAGGVLEVHASE